MKKTLAILFFLAVIAAGFTSCGKDDGNARPGDKGTFTLRGSGSSA